jgi:hydroxyacylglutathione hydrolase
MPGITIIILSLPFRLGSVNCYLVGTSTGFILIDTGGSNQRAQLADELTLAGCKPGNLQLIVLTHGDFDHAGNCAYLRREFGTRIAMHRGDSGMVERANMFSNRRSGNVLFRMVAPILFRFSRSDRFEPDVYVEEGYRFTEYGFDAEVLSIPGHSKGSIGILTAGGDLFCGDLLQNHGTPDTGSIIDDPAEADASIEKLLGHDIHTVYPGHGLPFAMAAFTSARSLPPPTRR